MYAPYLDRHKIQRRAHKGSRKREIMEIITNVYFDVRPLLCRNRFLFSYFLFFFFNSFFFRFRISVWKKRSGRHRYKKNPREKEYNNSTKVSVICWAVSHKTTQTFVSSIWLFDLYQRKTLRKDLQTKFGKQFLRESSKSLTPLRQWSLSFKAQKNNKGATTRRSKFTIEGRTLVQFYPNFVREWNDSLD